MFSVVHLNRRSVPLSQWHSSMTGDAVPYLKGGDMPQHDIIVVGASAGGLEALQTLVPGRSGSLPLRRSC